MADRRIVFWGSILVLVIVFLPLIILSLGLCLENINKENFFSLERTFISQGQAVQSAVKNFAYVNKGHYPLATYHKGRDGRAMSDFLPLRSKMINLTTGRQTEPRDFQELVINGRPDPHAIYYRYFPEQKKYVIYCYNALDSLPVLILQ